MQTTSPRSRKITLPLFLGLLLAACGSDPGTVKAGGMLFKHGINYLGKVFGAARQDLDRILAGKLYLWWLLMHGLLSGNTPQAANSLFIHIMIASHSRAKKPEGCTAASVTTGDSNTVSPSILSVMVPT